MKHSKLIYLALTLNLAFCFEVFAQNISITDDDSYSPDNSAMLDVKSTSKGFLPPRMTNSEISAISNPATGLIVFSTNANRPLFFDGTTWCYFDGSEFFLAGVSTVSDYDGNEYQTIQIGNQIWMAENLRTTHYAAGTTLVDGKSAGDISADYTTKYYFWYANDSSSNAETYGALYTWAAVMNGAASSDVNPSGVQGVCPTGWHMPSDAEWTELTDYLTNNGYGYEGSGSDIGKSMASTSGWTSSGIAGDVGNDQASNNSSGFMALPGGYRSNDGSFYGLGNNADFWSSTEGDASSAWGRELAYASSDVYRYSNLFKNYGFSARCLQD